mmetsp:Transcript_5606/g.8614  ORF Transcript_5606/g.8614 Transcript_5606/m.8614 type:complete len:282 (-) Transcript_5606:1512-2357(-)
MLKIMSRRSILTNSILLSSLTTRILLIGGYNGVDAFVPAQKFATRSPSGSKIRMVPIDEMVNSLSVSVETFDGSAIDPVVVSDVFWNGLKAKILSVIIGQILASIAFLIITTVAATQISNLGNFLSEKLSRGDDTTRVSPSAQKLLDQTKTRTVNISPDFNKLLLCLVIDTIGTSSELVPILGEITDVAWAPIAGFALKSLYSSNVLFALEFAEEILPFTDILPLATICWIIDTFYYDSDIAKALGLGRTIETGTTDAVVIDVESDRNKPADDRSLTEKSN